MNCPDCGELVTEEKNYLTDEEWTMILSCTVCSFGLETESNLVAKERYRRVKRAV